MSVHPRATTMIKSIAAVSALVAASGLGLAGPAGAGPLEGDGSTEPTGRPACTALQRFLIDAEATVERDKAHSVIGLDGPDADADFAAVQAAVAASCS